MTNHRWLLLKTVLIVLLLASVCRQGRAEDIVELSNGATARGKLISQDDKLVVIEVMVNGRPYTRRYPRSTVKSVTINGVALPAATGAAPRRSRQEVLDTINTVGRTPPEWYESTALDIPDTLDLSWPEPAPQPWNNSRNVGQFVWDRVNPNPNQWRNGIKLMHHLMVLNKDDKRIVQRAMTSLGMMYHNLFEDYARAAFWWQQAGVGKNGAPETLTIVLLANCYWKLGSKELALETLKSSSRLPFAVIKVYGDIGETDQALRIAEATAKAGYALAAYLYAGDVCRVAGRLDDAESYYRKALAAAGQEKGNEGHINRDKQRAEASLAALKFFRLSPKEVADGTYTASSLGYEDQVHVEVVVAGGKITEVKVIKHREKQFYASLEETPRNILRRQSLVGIDTTSGATITSEAIINATAKALAAGKK